MGNLCAAGYEIDSGPCSNCGAMPNEPCRRNPTVANLTAEIARLRADARDLYDAAEYELEAAFGAERAHELRERYAPAGTNGYAARAANLTGEMYERVAAD